MVVARLEKPTSLSGEADDRRRPHRALLLHFPVPRRAAARARHRGGRRIHRDLRRGAARDGDRPRSEGLYRRALAGQIKNFTGIDQACETPEAAEMVLNSAQESAETRADRV